MRGVVCACGCVFKRGCRQGTDVVNAPVQHHGGSVVDRLHAGHLASRIGRYVSNDVVDWHKRVLRPRLASVWAAASASAGHQREQPQESQRHLIEFNNCQLKILCTIAGFHPTMAYSLVLFAVVVLTPRTGVL